jgi:hypothetical protein
MSPALLAFITEFTLRMIEEFKSSGTVLTEQEIKDRFEADFAIAMKGNQLLLDETS